MKDPKLIERFEKELVKYGQEKSKSEQIRAFVDFAFYAIDTLRVRDTPTSRDAVTPVQIANTKVLEQLWKCPMTLKPLKPLGDYVCVQAILRADTQYHCFDFACFNRLKKRLAHLIKKGAD